MILTGKTFVLIVEPSNSIIIEKEGIFFVVKQLEDNWIIDEYNIQIEIILHLILN